MFDTLSFAFNQISEGAGGSSSATESMGDTTFQFQKRQKGNCEDQPVIEPPANQAQTDSGLVYLIAQQR